jgi:oligosaccharyl transferase complex subunit OST4
MISDNDLYRLAIFLGTAAMILIVVYHYLEVNTDKEAAVPHLEEKAKAARAAALK